MGKGTNPPKKNGYEGIGRPGGGVPEGETELVPFNTMFHKYIAIQRRSLEKEALATLIDRLVYDLKRIVRKRTSTADKGGDNAH
jgi:hypothetical protein